MFRILWPTTQFNAAPRVSYEHPAYHARYEKALAATGTRDNPMRRMRYYGIEQAVVHASKNVQGDAIEIGCLAGHSAWLAADGFRRAGRQLTFHLCDSFEGLSDYTEKDRPGGVTPSINPAALKCSEDVVRKNLSEFDVFKFHKGWIPAPFEALQDARFCYAHIDVDLYEPTRDSLSFVWERLNPRGILLFDDYGSLLFPGARAAIDEFFSGRQDFFLHEQPAGQAVAVKIG